MGDYLMIVLGTALVNNVVLVKFLGLCPFMGVSNKLDSALGMGLADQRLLRDRAVEAVLNEQLMPGLSADLDELQQEAVSAMVQQGVPLGHIRCEHRLHLRYLRTWQASPPVWWESSTESSCVS